MSSIGLSQHTFQTVLPISPQGVSVDENSKGDIFVSTDVFVEPLVVKAYLAKINKHGELLWSKVYDHTPKDDFDPLVTATPDGGCLLSTESFSYAESSIRVILTWKIDKEGNIEWQRIDNTIIFSDQISCSDGNHILLGMEWIESEYSGLGTIRKINVNGDLIWETIFGDGLDEPLEWGGPVTIPNTVTEIDGYLYIAAEYEPDPGSSMKEDGRLYKLNSHGELIWSIKLPQLETSVRRGILDVFKFNEEYYFKGRDGTYWFDPETAEYQKVQNSIYMFTHHYGENFGITCNVATTIRRDTGVTYFQQYSDLTEQIFEREVPSLYDPIILNYKASIDGGHIVVSGADGGSMVTKLDCQGNDFWSDECSSKIQKGASIALYPNPTSDLLQIETEFDIEEIELYDLTGRVTRYTNTCYCKQHEIDVSELAAGTYRMVVLGKNEHVISSFIKG